MLLAQDHLEAIIASVLAVNVYGLEKAYALLPEFRKCGLTDPLKVVQADIAEVMVAFQRAGYNRGMLSEMMAGRLMNLMTAAAEGHLDTLNEMVSKRKRAEAEALLCQIKGIGPKVASDAWMLFTSGSDKG